MCNAQTWAIELAERSKQRPRQTVHGTAGPEAEDGPVPGPEGVHEHADRPIPMTVAVHTNERTALAAGCAGLST